MKKKTPPIDVRKVIRAAAEAALEDPAPVARPKKRRLSTGRALMLGAGLWTAGRMLAGGRGNGLLGSLQDRLDNLGVQLQGHDDDEEPEVEDLGDVAEPEEEAPEEPVATADENGEEEPDSNGGAPERQPRRQRRGRA